MIRLIEDAGGEYVYTKNDSDTSVAVDLEEAYLLASSADVWLNVGPCNTLAELTAQNPKFAGIPAVRNRMVFNNNRRQTPAGGSDFWESASYARSGAARPEPDPRRQACRRGRTPLLQTSGITNTPLESPDAAPPYFSPFCRC